MQSVIKLSKKLSQLKQVCVPWTEGGGGAVRRGAAGKQNCCVCDRAEEAAAGWGRGYCCSYKGNGKMIVILRIRTVIPKYFDSVTREESGM